MNLSIIKIPFEKIIFGMFVLVISGFDLLAKPAYANDYNYFFNRAYNKIQEGDYRESILNLNRAIELDPKQANAYFNRAISKRELGDHYGAISDYNSAISIDSSDPDSYWGLGYNYHKIESYNNAIKNIDKAISYKKNDINLLSLRATIKYDMGDEKGACKDWKKTIKLGDKDHKNWYNSDQGAWCKNMNKNDITINKPPLGEVLSDTPFMWKK